MTRHLHSSLSELGAEFAERLVAFHAALPAEHQALLEGMVSIAERATAPDDDTYGLAMRTRDEHPAVHPSGPQDLRPALGFASFSFTARVSKATPKLF